MSVSHLLLRGMIAGLVAGLLAFGFAKTFGEPAVDRAITFETAEIAAAAKVAAARGEPVAPEYEIFSRRTQAGIGLFTGVMVYSVALGGIFSLIFALGYGRLSQARPRTFAALLAGAAFVALYLVPYIKYPANPPSIGEPATIGLRTALYFSTITLSIVAMLTSLSFARIAEQRWDRWNANLLGLGLFVLLVSVIYAVLPTINEVPEAFPAAALWTFRVSSLGIQAIMWTMIGLVFGALVERRVRAG